MVIVFVIAGYYGTILIFLKPSSFVKTNSGK
jgi:hypothetical protein